jgi:hypothetical protein
MDGRAPDSLLRRLRLIQCFHAAACLLLCAYVPAALASEHICGPAFLELPQTRLSESSLSAVRAGSPVPNVPRLQLGVILWDEPRLPPVPVRNVSDTRINAEMNTYVRQ